jgi:hypothetical protein
MTAKSIAIAIGEPVFHHKAPSGFLCWKVAKFFETGNAEDATTIYMHQNNFFSDDPKVHQEWRLRSLAYGSRHACQYYFDSLNIFHRAGRDINLVNSPYYRQGIKDLETIGLNLDQKNRVLLLLGGALDGAPVASYCIANAMIEHQHRQTKSIELTKSLSETAYLLTQIGSDVSDGSLLNRFIYNASYMQNIQPNEEVTRHYNPNLVTTDDLTLAKYHLAASDILRECIGHDRVDALFASIK